MLLQSHYNHITEVRLKKFYADFNNAIRMSEIENGPYSYWDDFWATHLTNVSNTKRVITQYLSPYLKIQSIDMINNCPYFVLPDGSAFSTSPSHPSGLTDIFFYPMNYKKNCLRYKAGVNVFIFSFRRTSPNASSYDTTYWKYVNDKGLVPYLYSWDGKIETLYTHKTYGCKNGNGYMCSAVIWKNNWKIPKDYPAKIRY